jgi:hypothetical protein
MATLSANINATQTVIPVSGAAPQTGSFLTVDSEAIKFLGTSRGPQGRSFLRDYWSVDRGVAGTTAATHSNGATLTQYYPDAAGGVGGSGVNVDNGVDPPAAVTTLVAPGAVIAGDSATLLTTRLLGPFTVTSATPDIGDGAFLADIAEGTIIVRTWAVTDTAFDTGAILTIGLGSADFGPPDDDWDTLSYHAVDNLTGNPGRIFETPTPDGALPPRVGISSSTGVLTAYIAQAVTQGSARVYAIIATPAS